MDRVLFVANGHGENAIAARIARSVAALATEPTGLDLLSLVGRGAMLPPLVPVGPRRPMPSGGLVAMGNVGAFGRDLREGFLGLFARQLAFLARSGGRYDAVVAVGDAYALALALLARVPAIFVGTAKSAFVAPYGPFERTLIRRALRTYVRDELTAERLRALGTPAQAPGNAIVDLVADDLPARPGTWLGLLPGSRTEAYGDGLRLARVVRALAARRPGLGALCSIAPALDPTRFATALSADGWQIEACAADGATAFEAVWPAQAAGTSPGVRLVAWRGPLGALLRASLAVLGQAGTANEQAAACGVPVVALASDAPGRNEWYRMRQRRLLGDALLIVPSAPAAAAAALDALLADPRRMAAMGAAGRARMGGTGGAEAIARGILTCLG